jgi:serine/threonine-protein kinase
MIEPANNDTLVGQVLAERYRVERLLGEGGMGQVYLARHVRTGRRLAVKLLAPEAAGEAENVERFEREARALGGLGHPNIVGIHDFAETEDGRPFLVMDYLEGEELAERLERGGRLPWPQARRIFESVASALHAAHQAGVLHRDLKPGNLFLSRSPDGTERVVLLDFGLAKSVSREEARVTRTGIIMGTPLYMSPEQARGAELDVRSDVYSLAAVLFELLAGRPPFEGDSWTAILTALLVDPPPPLSQHVPTDLPAHLDGVIATALSKDPAFRPPDVASFAAQVLGERPVWAGTVSTPGAVAGTTPAGLAVPAAPLPRPVAGGTGPEGDPGLAGGPGPEAGAAAPARRLAGVPPIAWALAALLLLAGGVAAGLLLGGSGRSHDEEPAARSGPATAMKRPGPARPDRPDPGRGAVAPMDARASGAADAPAASARRRAAAATGAPSRPAAAAMGAPSRPAAAAMGAPSRPAAAAMGAPSRPAAALPRRAGAPVRASPGRAARVAPTPRRRRHRRGQHPPARASTRPRSRSSPAARPRRRPTGREAVLALLPANERAAVEAMRRSDWAACLRATSRPPVTARILQMRVSCGMSGRRPAAVRRACAQMRQRFASHPFTRACKSILRALDAQARASARRTPARRRPSAKPRP